MQVFCEHGYLGGSIQDLEDAMGLKCTSIYNAFGNKRAFFERVTACFKESVMAKLFAGMDAAPNIRDGIRRLPGSALDSHFDEANPGGCLVVIPVLESGQHDSHSRALLQQTIQDLRNALRSRLNHARKAGELAPDPDTAATAATIATTMTGMMVMGKANFTRAALKKTVNQVVRLLG
jgi:TetR/AcrR family transcriptional repressor of nem operon